MKNNIALEVQNISKKFEFKNKSLKDILLNLFTKKEKSTSNQVVLKNISFSVKKGSAFCITGPNGVGKSTILSIILGIIKADQGTVKTFGKVVAMNELGGGFHPDLTGRDNVFVNGRLMGNRLSNLKTHFDDIIAFSGLNEFIDRPLRTYSNGMIARLAFSIIAFTTADIILIDEVLAVGDEQFRKKCINHFRNFKKNGGTIVMVSHDLGIINNFCDEGIYISSNIVSPKMNTKDLIEKYINKVEYHSGL